MSASYLRVCLLLPAICAGCAITPIPAGTYETSGTNWQSQLIVLPQAIDPDLFHPDVHYYSYHFGAEGEQNICIVRRWFGDDGQTDTSLTLAKPDRKGRGWRVGIHDTHHSREWLILKVKGGEVTSTYHSVGLFGWIEDPDDPTMLISTYRGPESHQLPLKHVGGSSLASCVAAGHEVLEQVRSWE